MKTDEPKPTGFDLIDVDKFFIELNLQKGIAFLDVACGRGAYCLAAAEIVGKAGRIIGVDLWEGGIELLKAAAIEKSADNITALVSDAGKQISVDDQSIDVCLMATVLHDFVADKIDQEVLSEIVRVVKPGGALAVMEFKKTDGPPGPPRRIRLSPEEVDTMLEPFGFERTHLVDVGPNNYLSHENSFEMERTNRIFCVYDG
jgi:ubiquinone/menaquinone biosynthesis C-methylase UbiE